MMKIYDFVVSILGPVPMELEFIYAIGTLFILFMLLWAVTIPYKLIYDWCK